MFSLYKIVALAMGRWAENAQLDQDKIDGRAQSSQTGLGTASSTSTVRE